MQALDNTRDMFTYSVRATNLAPGASQTQILNIQADANFVAVKTTYEADIAGAAQTDSTKVLPLVRIAINDSGSGRNLQNISVAIDAIAGRGELPFVLPIPREFSASSSISITFENYSAATTYANVEFSLIGYKRFK